jgi:hypothetical protein
VVSGRALEVSLDPLERGHDGRPPAVGDALSLGREDEVVRAAVRGVWNPAGVAARDEAADVVADRRRREPGLRRESLGVTGWSRVTQPMNEKSRSGTPIVASSASTSNPTRSPVEYSSWRRSASCVFRPSGTARILRWTYCEFVDNITASSSLSRRSG